MRAVMLEAPESLLAERQRTGAELVVEILSRNDETYDKLPFYADLGVAEVLVVDPATRAVELFENRGGTMERAVAGATGAVRSTVLGVEFSRVAGPLLRIAWPGGRAEI